MDAVDETLYRMQVGNIRYGEYVNHLLDIVSEELQMAVGGTENGDEFGYHFPDGEGKMISEVVRIGPDTSIDELKI